MGRVSLLSQIRIA